MHTNTSFFVLLSPALSHLPSLPPSLPPSLHPSLPFFHPPSLPQSLPTPSCLSAPPHSPPLNLPLPMSPSPSHPPAGDNCLPVPLEPPVPLHCPRHVALIRVHKHVALHGHGVVHRSQPVLEPSQTLQLLGRGQVVVIVGGGVVACEVLDKWMRRRRRKWGGCNGGVGKGGFETPQEVRGEASLWRQLQEHARSGATTFGEVAPLQHHCRGVPPRTCDLTMFVSHLQPPGPVDVPCCHVDERDAGEAPPNTPTRESLITSTTHQVVFKSDPLHLWKCCVMSRTCRPREP